MTHRARQVCLALFPGLISLITGAYLASTSKWFTFGVPTTGAHFGDLKVILLASECAQQDPDWSLASMPCSQGMAIYNYPSLWAKAFALLGIGSDQAAIVAGIFILLFACTLSALALMTLRQGNLWFPTLTLCLTAVSPPVLLAFERGNIDIVIFAITVISILFLVSGMQRSSALALGAATALKLFPVGSALMFIPLARRRIFTSIAFAATTLLGLLLIARDLPTIYSRTPALDGASFGSSLLPLLTLNHFGSAGYVTGAKVIGITCFAVVSLCLLLLGRGGDDRLGFDRVGNSIRADSTSTSLVLAGGGSFLVAYLIGPSFDYRLITLIPLIAGLARIGSVATRVAAVVLIVQLFLSYSTFVGAAEYLSDLMLIFIAPYMLIVLIMTMKRSPDVSSHQPV